MRLLLDTHAFLWWVGGTPALGRRARAEVANPDNEVFLSIASCWDTALADPGLADPSRLGLECSSRAIWRAAD